MIDVLEHKIIQAIRHLDNRLAWEVLVMASKDQSIQLDPAVKLKLNYIRLNSLSPNQVSILLEKSILTTFEIEGYDLLQRIVDYTELLDSVPDQVEFVQRLRSILENHQEILGPGKLVSDGKQTSSTIANWLLDYKKHLLNRNSSALEELKYINTSENPKLLSSTDRIKLQSVLKLYDLVLQYTEFWSSIPDQLSDEEYVKFENYLSSEWEKIELQNNSVDSDIENPKLVMIDESRTKGVTTQDSRIALDSVITKQNQPKPQEKRGLVFDVPTNIDLEEVEQESKKQDQAQQQIADKLAALKQRKNNK